MKNLCSLILLTALLFLPLSLGAQTLLPRPDPPRLVNDFAGCVKFI